ncbi:MAG: caspase family protein, partial [Gammaproteobacteria bacterium]
ASSVYQQAATSNAGEPALPTSTQVVQPPQTLVQKVRLLLQLHNEGLISKAELEQRKRSLLDSALQPVRTASLTTPESDFRLAEGIEFGKFHALVIGNNAYKHFPQLETAIADANAVAKMLQHDYGFSVKTLTDARRYDVVKALSALRASLSEEDNLLIYYAGHGYLDDATGRGYWLPVDAEDDNAANWVSTSDVTDALHGMSARHVIVVADSCYSGTLTRAGAADLDNRKALIKRLAGKRSRTVLSSGGLEPVLDSGGGNHSVFANALLGVLDENDGVLEGSRLFTELRQRVVLGADQTPEYADIRKAGHEGGDFIFVRRR